MLYMPAQEKQSLFCIISFPNHDEGNIKLITCNNKSMQRTDFYIYGHNVQVRGKTTKDQDITGHFFFKIPNKLLTNR